ncbi:MAG: FHA domain-containing protein, partial [Gammaproteobacteria bacterium]|nr:FHA domain-containing protein [Gammaproteobacteria bacterium]
ADFYVSMAVLQAAEQGVRIGRNPDSCDYVVAAAAVSREHCRVFLADGRLMLEDLKSANGSCIGARKLEAHAPQQIQDGDRMVLGNIVFQVAYVA